MHEFDRGDVPEGIGLAAAAPGLAWADGAPKRQPGYVAIGLR